MGKKGKSAENGQAYADKMAKRQEDKAGKQVTEAEGRKAEAEAVRKLIKSMPKTVEEGSEWFLVSMKWIQKWQAYVGFEGDSSGKPPGQIDNSDIILFNFPKVDRSVLLGEMKQTDQWMDF